MLSNNAFIKMNRLYKAMNAKSVSHGAIYLELFKLHLRSIKKVIISLILIENCLLYSIEHDKYPEVLSGLDLFLPEQAFVSNLADKRCCVDDITIKIAEFSTCCKIEIKQSRATT